MPRHLTGLTALEFYGHLSNVPTSIIKQRRGPLLEKVGLAERAKDPVRTYSKGMLQRLGLAQAMLHDPELFILDEPTDGLDPLARSQVRGYLTELKRQGKTIFLNSHILQEVELICDRVAILDRGVLRRVANVAEITSGRVSITEGGNGQPHAAQEALELHLDLTGPEATIRQMLGSLPISSWQPFSPTDFRVVTRVPSQPAVDELIDRLRSSGDQHRRPLAAAGEPGRGVLGDRGRSRGLTAVWSLGACDLVHSIPMRPYLAIIKDSFREAIASRVLWVLLALITVKLIALAATGIRVDVRTDFVCGDMVEGPRLAGKLRQAAAADEPSPGKRMWGFIGEGSQQKLIALDASPERRSRRVFPGNGSLAELADDADPPPRPVRRASVEHSHAVQRSQGPAGQAAAIAQRAATWPASTAC